MLAAKDLSALLAVSAFEGYAPNSPSACCCQLKGAAEGKGPHSKGQIVLALLAQNGFTRKGEDAELDADSIA